MDIIAAQGNYYGLVFNWSKLEYMCIGCSPTLVQPDGSLIKCVTSMTYLGGLLSKDANITSELGRKIGYAMHSFSNLQRIWSHANLPIRRKLALFKSLILSKLQYGLESVWLNQCERKQLDAFHCKCLRRIMKIQHSFFSRISNMQVLAAASEEYLSTTMIKQQLKSFGRIATANDTHPLRRLVFDSDHIFRKFSFNRRLVGRPKQCWVDEIYKIALSICGSEYNIAHTFHHGVESLDNWHRLIDQHFALDSID